MICSVNQKLETMEFVKNHEKMRISKLIFVEQNFFLHVIFLKITTRIFLGKYKNKKLFYIKRGQTQKYYM